MVTELGGSQISSLLETLPGIANVLRSPVADALVNTIRAAARLGELQLGDVEELIRYATRRGLLGNDEGDRILNETRDALQRRADKAAERAADRADRAARAPAAKVAAAPAPKPAPPRPAPKPAAKAKPAAKSAAKPIAKQAKPKSAKPKSAKPARLAARAKPVKKAAKNHRKR